MGEILRGHMQRGTEIGRAAASSMSRGELVPDKIVLHLIDLRLAQSDASTGAVLDGVPRDLAQAEALDADPRSRPDVVLLLDVPDGEVRRRAGGRRRCPNGHLYHLRDQPPRIPGRCDIDAQPLHQRHDDRPEALERRLAEYRREGGPVIKHYRQRAVLIEIDGTGRPDHVHRRVLAGLP